MLGPTGTGPDSGIENGDAVGAGVAASQTKVKSVLWIALRLIVTITMHPPM